MDVLDCAAQCWAVLPKTSCVALTFPSWSFRWMTIRDPDTGAAEKDASTEAVALHAEFLEALTSELDRRDVFRTLLGPGHPAHRTHFHFDMAPYSYVQL